MEDQFTTITTNIQGTPVGDRIQRIKELVGISPGIIIRPVRIDFGSKAGRIVFIIEPAADDHWLALIDPDRGQVRIESKMIPFDDNSEKIVLQTIIRYYHDKME